MPLPIFRHFKTLIVTLIFLLIFINITGHLGGSLTHGEDFLTSSFRSDKQNQKRKISNMNDAYVFNDIVQPILQDKCGSCHNSSKKKGKLSVESYDAIIKGGKHGRVIKPGDTTGSEIIKRISLDPQDEKFMPADNKTPLTAGETAIIKWWIEKAAGKKDTKLSEIGLPDNIKNNILAYLEIPNNSPSENYTVSNINAPPVAREVIEKLEQLGYVIKYLNFKPDLLDISLMPSTDNEIDPDKIKALLQVKDNIIWLNVSGNNVSDTEMEIINQFKNIHQLKLYNNPITDKGIAKIQGLNNMVSINLYDTKITKACLPYLIKLPALKTVYAWGTGIKKEDAVSQVSGIKIITGE